MRRVDGRHRHEQHSRVRHVNDVRPVSNQQPCALQLRPGIFSSGARWWWLVMASGWCNGLDVDEERVEDVGGDDAESRWMMMMMMKMKT